MNSENLETGFGVINSLLSRLHTDLNALESSHFQVLAVLRRLESVTDLSGLKILDGKQSLQQKWEALLAECERLNSLSGGEYINTDVLRDAAVGPRQLIRAQGKISVFRNEAVERVAAILDQFEVAPVRIAG